MNAMNFPDFFDQVPCITLRDPLADLLGSATGGLMRYGYADAVRLAGHSCPTVASAYWLGVRAIKSLFSDEIPIRGDIEVSLRDPLESGTTGVVANVLGLLTGAAGGGGFSGIGGQFVRRGLLQFNVNIETELRFTRTDTGQTVLAQAHPNRVSGDAQTMRLMQLCLSGQATDEQRLEFGRLWQLRVQHILLDHAWDDTVFELRTV
jgi:hypothetical protein